MRRTLVLCAALACFTPGCMTSPLMGERFDSHEEEIEFSGYTAAPGRAMTVECYHKIEQPGTSAPLEEWIPFATAISTEQQLGDDDEAFYFETHAVVPLICWDEQDNYEPRRQTRIRIVDDATGYLLEAWAEEGYQCLAIEYLTGSSPIEARDACSGANGTHVFHWAGIQAPLD